MLGPLLNPANVRNQIVGVYSKEANIYKDVLKKKKKCLIAGHDGNDEIFPVVLINFRFKSGI